MLAMYRRPSSGTQYQLQKPVSKGGGARMLRAQPHRRRLSPVCGLEDVIRAADHRVQVRALPRQQVAVPVSEGKGAERRVVMDQAGSVTAGVAGQPGVVEAGKVAGLQ